MSQPSRKSALPRGPVVVGPADNGRRMSLDDFEFAKVKEGYRYELGRGVIVVSEIPNPPHFAQLQALRNQLVIYSVSNPGRIAFIAGASEGKLLIFDTESERHPDLLVYKTQPPRADSLAWREWIPEIVVEIVSSGSERRDYVEKREDYLALGVKEYWIVDANRREMLALRRYRGKWSSRTVRPPDTYTTRLLPGFVLAIEPVFDAADALGD